MKSVYMVLDESMSAWRPKTSQYGGQPNLTYGARKPKPLGTMFKNGVEATTGIVVYQDIVETKEVQREKKYNGEVSSLPLGEPILQHVGEVLRQCEGAKLASGGWVGGDAWFGSIPAVVELKKSSTFIQLLFSSKTSNIVPSRYCRGFSRCVIQGTLLGIML